jgi:hypothetical protein
MRLAIACLLLLTCVNSNAQSNSPLNVTTRIPVEPKDPTVTIADLDWMDKNKMDKEVTIVTDLAQSKLGAALRKDLSDLQTLQRIIDNDLVERDDFKTQQAMGVVMGYVLLADFPQALEWKVYRDKIGRSRALCVKGTQECLFPVTMLSRRMEVGSKPDVKKIYNDAIAMMADHLPQMPYGGGIMYRLPR